jgi:hypothetical protein
MLFRSVFRLAPAWVRFQARLENIDRNANGGAGKWVMEMRLDARSDGELSSEAPRLIVPAGAPGAAYRVCQVETLLRLVEASVAAQLWS